MKGGFIMDYHIYIPDTGIVKDGKTNLFDNAIACDAYAFKDMIGHGNAVASIFAQRVKWAKLYIYNHSPKKVHNERLVFVALEDIYKRVKSKPNDFHLINTSFMDFKTPQSELGKEIDYWGQRLVIEQGATWCTAASNEGKAIADIIIPAGFHWATVIGGMDKTGTRKWDKSNTGGTIDFMGPSEHVYIRKLGGWTYGNGTSLATPYVGSQAVEVARYLYENNIVKYPKDMDVYNAMIKLAVDRGRIGRDDEFGYGDLDLKKLPLLLADSGTVPNPKPDTIISKAYGFITIGDVNFRVGPSINHNVIKALGKDTHILAFDNVNGWRYAAAYINSKFQEGYVSNDYLKLLV